MQALFFHLLSWHKEMSKEAPGCSQKFQEPGPLCQRWGPDQQKLCPNCFITKLPFNFSYPWRLCKLESSLINVCVNFSYVCFPPGSAPFSFLLWKVKYLLPVWKISRWTQVKEVWCLVNDRHSLYSPSVSPNPPNPLCWVQRGRSSALRCFHGR